MSENLPHPNDIYERLGVQKDSSAETIHKHFLKLVRHLLVKIKADQADEHSHLEQLRALWVAHDILMDPDSRTNYDLRTLGINTSDINEEEATSTHAIIFGAESGQTKSAPWRIGELLQAVGLLEKVELDIACDMHKAMPGMQFGQFLVKQGFIGEKQLQATLIGQILLRAGKITLSQLLSIMPEVIKSNRDIKELLLEHGYIKESVLLKLKDCS